MTPEKTKKPLSRPYAGVRKPGPTPFQLWRGGLRDARALFDKGQYKECTSFCERLLDRGTTRPHPTHAAALNFYIAISNELIARAQHNLSSTKLPLLNTARSSYLTALSLLPKPETDSPTLDDAMNYSDDGSEYSSPSESSGMPRTPHLGPLSPLPGQPADSYDDRRTKGRTAFYGQFCVAADAVVPAPLFAPAMPPGSPARVRSPQAQRVAFLLPILTPTPTPPRAVSEARMRYNAHLADFRQMLDRHHSEVISLIVTTMEVQANRYSGLRQSIFVEREAENEDLKATQLQERIKRLRAKGWRRERFNPSRYEDLCEQALTEL